MTRPNDKTIQVEDANQAGRVCQNVLDATLRQGAQRLRAEAIEHEVEDHIRTHSQLLDQHGRRMVVRNGHLPGRAVQSGIGPIDVKVPRVDERREGHQFTSGILPRYLRKVPGLENLIPTLYLMGVSSSDMQPALEALPGPGARGIPPSTPWGGSRKSGRRNSRNGAGVI